MSTTHKTLVTFGCSLTKDNYFKTWANHLSDRLDIPLINKAERGAGYDYISDAVLKTLPSIDMPLCVVMWPTADRLDLWVNDAVPQLQEDIEHASWPDGIEPAFCTVDGYSNKKGYYINGAAPRGVKNVYYKYFYTQEHHINNAWKTIVLIQHYLECKNIPYVMCNSHALTQLIECNYDSVDDRDLDFFNQIDLTKFTQEASTMGLLRYRTNNNLGEFSPYHPDTHAHESYVDNMLIPLMLKNKLI
jgi:hypothetical protein